jgi:malate dehydrogenase
VFVFGNHSLTQYPCIAHIRVKGRPVREFVSEDWLRGIFIPSVQKRGGEILNVRGGSSVFSAACAIVDHLRDWAIGTDKVVSMGVASRGEYGIPAGLFPSLPVRCGKFRYEVVKGIELSEFCQSSIAKTVKEMKEEMRDVEVEPEQIKAKL